MPLAMPSVRTLFDQGRTAAEVIFDLREAYVCPLCGACFTADTLASKELTREHVPPASQGGKGIILTCRSCNNTAGHDVDANAANRKELDELTKLVLHGERGKSARVRITWGEQLLNADVAVGEDGVTELRILGPYNDPARVEAASRHMQSLMKERRTDGYTFQLTSRQRFNIRLARVSDLRAAFLACTAKFGYRYASDPVLALIRDQIQRPKDDLLNAWWATLRQADMESCIKVFQHEGIVSVSWMRTAILLPWPTQSIENYLARMSELRDKHSITLTAHRRFDWPTSFEAILDKLPIREARIDCPPASGVVVAVPSAVSTSSQ